MPSRISISRLVSFWVFFLGCFTASIDAAIAVGGAMPVDLNVQIQLIQTFTSDHKIASTTLGNATQRSYIEGQVERIWAQAGVNIQFFPTVNLYNDDFAFDDRPNDHTAGSGNARSTGDLSLIVQAGNAAGVGSNSLSIIDLYFVEIVPGWEETGDYYTNGRAFIGKGGIAFYVGDLMLSSPSNMDIVAGVLSHEIGHNLGLDHLMDSSNLMNPTIYQGNLNADQIAKIRNTNSALLQPIPEPTASMLASAGFTLLFLQRQRRRLAA